MRNNKRIVREKRRAMVKGFPAGGWWIPASVQYTVSRWADSKIEGGLLAFYSIKRERE